MRSFDESMNHLAVIRLALSMTVNEWSSLEGKKERRLHPGFMMSVDDLSQTFSGHFP